MASIKKQIEIQSTPAQLFEAIISERAIKAWWTTDVEIEPAEGEFVDLGFYERAIVIRFRIEALRPHSMIKWVCLAGPEEYLKSEIVFEISSSDPWVTLTFEHSGLGGSDEFITHATQSWERVLNSLKSYVETGQGRPISM